MRLIIIPLLIIALIVGFYYRGDIWKILKPSVPGLEGGKLQLPGFDREEQPDSAPAPASPFDSLR